MKRSSLTIVVFAVILIAYSASQTWVRNSAASGDPALSVSPTIVVPGGTVTATWSGIDVPTPTDWIGLYAAGAPEPAYVDWMYVSCMQSPTSAQADGACPFTIPSTLAGGMYELRLFSNNTAVQLATSGVFTVSVSVSATLSVTPTTIAPGDTITATWSGIGAPSATDWIGLYAAGAPEPAYIDWMYVSCMQSPTSAQADGACPFTIPSTLAGGMYELRLFSNNTAVQLATSGVFTVSVSVSATLSVTPTTIAPGDTVTATWSGIGAPSATDWIGLYAAGAPETAYIDWMYVSCTQSPMSAQAAGSCPFRIPSTLAGGMYELRLFSNNQFVQLATSAVFTVSVSVSATFSVSPTTVAPGGTVTATWSGIGAPSATDWIGLYATGAPDGAYIDWMYVSCTQSPTSAQAAGSCPFTIASTLAGGMYELRLFSNGTAVQLATSGVFTVAATSLSYGLEWPGDGSVRRMLYWHNPFPIYDATYIFKVYPRKKTDTTQYNYYTTFFWGNDGAFGWNNGNADTYYGAHPYPIPAPHGPGQWEISVGSSDYVTGTEVGWDRWYIQAFRAWRESPTITHHEFYYDLPDMSKVITQTINDPNWAQNNPPTPAIVMGQAPNVGGVSWGGYPGWEEFNGIIRGIQIYSGLLSLEDIQSEIASPESTTAGQNLIWYLNTDPRPTDVTDKKGIGTSHDPSWDGTTALEWSSSPPGAQRPTNPTNISAPSSETRAGVFADTIAPTTPTNLGTVAVSNSEIHLNWNPSSDDVAVAGYRVFRNGALINTTASNSYSDAGLATSTTYTYAVLAFDASGNASPLSPPENATTLTVSALPAGLIAGYSFDEGTGTTTSDSSTNANTGTLTGGATWSTGKYGNAISFNGTTSYVSISNNFDIPTLPFTISAWVNPTNYNDYRKVFSKRDRWSRDAMRVDLTLDISTGRVVLEQPASVLRFSYSPPVNTWTHIAVVARTDGTDLYVNGSFRETLAVFSLGTRPTAGVRIGRAGDGQDPFLGTIDDVRIYNRALSHSEVQTDMNNPR